MMGAESDSSLTRARNAVEAGNDRDALNALGHALHRGKKKSDVEMLEEVGALAQIVGSRSSGSLTGRADRLAYAASQNVRQIERRSATEGERTPKPTLGEWLAIVGWLVVVIGVGIVAGDAFGDALVADPFPADHFVFGFIAVPLALGMAAGVGIRARASVVEGLLLAAIGAFVLGMVIALQLDLKPGSEACPSGCEDDVGYAGTFAIFAVFLPLAAGVVGAKFIRRRLAG